MMEFTWGFYTVCIITSQMGFLIGSCCMFVSLAEDITNDLETMNKVQENQRELTEKFMKFIRLHSEAKQLSEICKFLKVRYFVNCRISYFVYRNF